MYGWKETSQDALSADCPNLAHWIVKVNHLKKGLIEQGLEIEVCLLSEDEKAFPAEEAKIVGAKQGLIRQMYFTKGDSPLTYGRTIVPEPTYQAFYQQFKSLGSRAIGEALLHDKSHVVRGSFEFGVVAEGSDLFQCAVQGVKTPPSKLWGRRSSFFIDNYQLLIIELFFPSLPVFKC